METSTAKRHRTYGPNKSAVLHAVGDLRLVSIGRGGEGRGEGGGGGGERTKSLECWLTYREYTFSYILSFCLRYLPLPL